MAKSSRAPSKQMPLVLPEVERNRPQPALRSVATFVDAKTLKIRRDAVERVASSGIFSLSKRKIGR